MDYIFNGRNFKSEEALCDAFCIRVGLFRQRIQEGMTIEQAIMAPITDHNGREYTSEEAMCIKYGIRHSSYVRRLNAGWSQKRALETPLRVSKNNKGTNRNSIQKYTTFDELYKLWEYCIARTKLAKEIKPIRIYLDTCELGIEIHSYDWCSKETLNNYYNLNQFDRLAYLLENGTTTRVLGVSRTLEQLVLAKDDKARAALWIVSYIAEIGKTRKLTDIEQYIYYMCWKYAEENGIKLWYIKENNWLPYIYEKYYVIGNKADATIENLMSVIVLNAQKTLKAYKPVFLTSVF